MPVLPSTLEISSREDLQVPAVALKYEKSHTEDGVVWANTEVDKYPPEATGSEPRALVATIDLQGSAASFEVQSLDTEVIDPDSKTFWKDQIPALRGYLDSNLTISQATDDEGNPIPFVQKVSDGTASTMPRYVTGGAVAEWMTGVQTEEVVVTAKITYNGAALSQFENGVASTRLVGVDTSKTSFERLVSFDEAEATPVGLAQALYEALGTLHFEGNYSVMEEEVSGVAHPGNTLRLIDGLAEWATMDATIQQVVENVDTGKTQIFFGPPQHLGPQDLVAQLRANRNARASWRRKERETGQRTASGGYSAGPQKTPKQNAAFAPTGGSGTGLRFIGASIGSTTNASSIQTAINAAYSAASFTPKAGDVIVSEYFLFLVGPATLAHGSYPSSSFVSIPLAGGLRASQIGPNRFVL